MKHFYSFIASLLFLSASTAFGQLIVNDNVTATDLANQIVGSGVTVSNVQLRCGDDGYGTFSNGNTTNVGLTNGILLTTGHADDAKGPNTEGNTTVNQPNSYNGDGDLDPLTPHSINDVCALSFDFVAQSDFITVQYVFGSEEYNEYVCSEFNDIFAFFVSGPNPLGGSYANQNVALVPFSTLPVSINTINRGVSGQHGEDEDCQSLSNSAYYINNPTGSGTTIGYDGFTVVLTAQIAIIPGQTYSFKFVIADLSDSNLDSGVFIKANSFSIFLCQAGTISFEPNSAQSPYCLNDGVADIVNVHSNSVTPGDNFKYLLTSSTGQILAINESGSFNMNSYGEGNFTIHAISYSGVVSGVTVGGNINNISANSIEGCFELSNPLTVQGINCTDLPILDCPDNLELSCINEVPAPNPNSVQVLEVQCPGNVTLSHVSDSYDGTLCNKTITRLYKGKDACHNIGYCYQTIHVADITAPEIVSAPEEEIWISCDAQAPELDVEFDDNCSHVLSYDESSSTNHVNNCEQVITRTITATDNCGNSTSFTQLVHVIDSTNPYVINEPADFSITCDEEIPASVAPSFGDNCDNDLQITPSFSTIELECGYKIVRTWTATDNCGNQATAEQVITVTDNVAPVAVNPPAAEIWVSCDEQVPALVVEFSDNCSDELAYSQISSTSYVSECEQLIGRTAFATDECGNQGSFSQLVHIIDSTDPFVVSTPDNFSISCDEEVPASVPPVFGDNCDSNLEITPASSTVDLECGYQIIRSWTATDNCGNQVTTQQTVTVYDNEAPVAVNAPAAEIWVSCDEQVPALVVEFQDNCSNELAYSQISSTSYISECEQLIGRTAFATDECGNQGSFSQLVHIIDTTAPEIVSEPSDISISCTDPIPGVVNPVFSDNCDSQLLITNDSTIVEEGCTHQIIRTWTATDNCGNQTTAEQVITIVDDVPPVFDPFTPYIHLRCDELDSHVGPTATDNCSDVTISYWDTYGSGGCYGVIIRTYTATDACGNTTFACEDGTSVIQYITLLDFEGPVIENPENATVECDNAPTEIPQINIYDECGRPVEILEATQTINVIDDCTYEIIWHWVAMDYCENISEATTVITVTDTTAPVISGGGEDQTFSCEAVIDAPQTPSFSDNCDEELTIAYEETTIPGSCVNNYQLVYTWTATDNCGNSSSKTVVYTIVDETAPVFGQNISEFTYECDEEIPLITPSASDNCGAVELAHIDADHWDQGCYSGFSRIWTATDLCGNTAQFVQHIQITDTTAPVITGQIEISRPCDDYNGNYVTVSDNCDEDITVTYHDELVSGGCEGRVIRTYTVSDDCENTAEFIQIITLTDHVAPVVVSRTENQTFECGSTPDAPVVIFSDNCDEELTLSSNVSTEGDNCTWVVTYTFTAEDNCHNISTEQVVYTFVDSTPPTVFAPQGGQFSCDQDIVYGEAGAEDNCNEVVSITHNDEIIEGECENEYTVVRTWYATDACGNTGSATSSYYVFDNQAPVFDSIDETLTVECSDAIPSTNYSVSDNCGDVIVVPSEEIIEGECSGEYTIVRTFTATDICGNQSEATHTIHVVDTTAPVFSGESTIELPCTSSEETIGQVYVSAEDNCSSAWITYEDDASDETCGGSILRTYTATDLCGNVSYFYQTIVLIDNEAPEVAPYEEEITVECGDEVPAFNPVFSDNCDMELTYVAGSSVAIDGCTEIITRSVTATDNCENETTVVQVVYIVDTTAPVWNGESFETTISCGTSINLVLPTASDLCHEVVVTPSFEVVQGECEGEYTEIHTFNAVDECGNAAESVVYTIHYVDETAPVFTFVPEGNTVSCTEFNGIEDATATDLCSDVVVTYSDETEPYSEESGDGDCGQLRTQTQGGWGAPAPGNPNANSPAVYRNNNFSGAFPAGVEIGCDDNKYVFTSALAIQNFLPAGGPSSTISGTSIDPTDVSNQLAAQLLAATLNVGFDNYDPNFGASSAVLGSIVYNSGAFEGFTVNEVIAFANDALGGCSTDYSLTALASALETLNSNYDDGDQDHGAFNCGGESLCGTLLTRTFTATDACGNQSTASVSYIIYDDEAPVFNGEVHDVTVSCVADIPALVDLTATDACMDAEVEVIRTTTVVESSNCGNQVIEVTYTATDNCNNTATTSYYITVLDDIAPVFSGESVIELPCTSSEETIGQVYVSAEDNCSGAWITYEDDASNETCGGSIHRTYTATDLCGNVSYFYQTIVLIDNEAPEVAPYEEEITVECSDEVPAFNPVFSDNCDTELVYVAGSSIAIDGCTEIITRTVTAIDDCENETTAVQVVYIVDTTAPVWNGESFETTISCGTSINLVLPTASDLCHEVVVTPSFEVVEGECEGEYTEIHTFNAVDECGNAAEPVVYTIHYVDNTAPVWDGESFETTVSCGTSVDIIAPTASDFCSEAVVTPSFERIDGDCAGEYTDIFTYNAVDACGNAAEPVVYIVHYYDNEAPVFTTQLTNQHYECAQEIIPAEVSAEDNCSAFEITSEVIEISSDECGNGTYEVVYTAIDGCGNSSTTGYIVTFSDTTDPELVGVPADLVIACDAEIPAPAEVTGTDNCSGTVTVEMVETLVGETPAEGSIADCRLITPVRPAGNPCNYSYDWAMALFGMPTQHRYYQVAEGNFVRYPDGSAHITATLTNAMNSNNGWLVDVWFTGEKDWSEWSTQAFPTSFKADCGAEGENHEDWLYFILQNGDGAELTGFGAYAGSAINLNHAPSNNYFGFQLGDGANNYNGADNGFGGWFTYGGSFVVDNGTNVQTTTVNGAGDFAFELDCCPRYEIVRCWTAFDCSGNETSACQTIRFEGSSNNNGGSVIGTEPAEEVVAEETMTIGVFPNPAVENAVFTFISPIKGRVKLEIFDMAGAKVIEAFNAQVAENTEYRVDVNVQNLARGVYMYRLSNGTDSEMGRLIISK